MNNLAPICLFVYNRLWHTQQTIKALMANELALESNLIIYADGAKAEEDKYAVNQLREYLKTISGFASVSIIEQSKNKGLANSIIDGVTEVVNRYGKVIVLEDDLVTSTKFLRFMNDALNYYGQFSNVASIHGYTYPLNPPQENDFFIYGADCWGWATWKEQWACFEPDGTKLLKRLIESGRSVEFNFENNYPYVDMLKEQISGENNSWAIRWKASCFLTNKLTLYPSKTFVENIGLDNSGTHCSPTTLFDHKSSNHQYSTLVKQEPQHSKQGYRAMSKFYKSLKPTMLNRIINKVRLLLSAAHKHFFAIIIVSK